MTTPPRHFGRSLKPFHYPRAWMVLWIMAIAIVVAGELLPGKDLPSLVDERQKRALHCVCVAVGHCGAVICSALSWAFVCLLLVLMGIALGFAGGHGVGPQHGSL